MKKQVKILVFFLVIIFNLYNLAFAGDGIGLSVSCTIPAIPGVNAPLNEKTNIEPQALEEKETQTSSFNLETQEEEPVFIEEIQETQLAWQTTPALTKVIYSR